MSELIDYGCYIYEIICKVGICQQIYEFKNSSDEKPVKLKYV